MSSGIQRIQQRFLRFALRKFRWVSNRQLPNMSQAVYQRCAFQKISLSCNPCPIFHCLLTLFKEDRHRTNTNYGANESLNAVIHLFNRLSNFYDFGVGGWGYEISYCVCNFEEWSVEDCALLPRYFQVFLGDNSIRWQRINNELHQGFKY
jgi:hypothetical protein